MPGIGPYVWGEAKHASNLKKHGVDFAIVEHFDLDGAVVFRDDRRDYGEERFGAFGSIKGRLHVLIFTKREGLYRVISLRRANSREMSSYAKSKKGPDS